MRYHSVSRQLKKEEITKSYIAGRLYCRFYKQTSLNNSKWASHLSWGTPSTPTPQLLPVWGFFFSFFFWRGGRLWISVTWSPPASRHMTPGTAEDKAHLKDSEKEMEGLGRGDCGANVRFHRHWGMLSVGTGMQRTRFPLRTQNSLSSPNPSISTSTTKMKHTASLCLSHHLESCTPLHQLCVVANQYEVLDIPSYNKSCLI